MKKEKLNFFKQLWIALFRPDQYGRIVTLGTGRTVGFVCLFSLIYTIIWMGSLMLTLDLDGIKEIIAKEVPDFYLENGELHLEKPYNLATKDTLICADSDVEKFELSDLEYLLDSKKYDGIMLISKTNLLIYTDKKYNHLEFSDFKIRRYTRDELFDSGVSYMKKAAFILSFFVFPILGIVHFIASLLLALLALIFSAIFGKGLSGGHIYRIGIYTYAAIMVAGLVFEVYLTVVPTTFAQFFYFVLAFAYTIVGVLSANQYVNEQRQEMAQRVAAPYGPFNGYGDPVYNPNANTFFNGPEVQEQGTYTNSLQTNNMQTNNMQTNNMQINSSRTDNTSQMNSDNDFLGQDSSGTDYQMSMYYGGNVIGRDGRLRTADSEKDKSENKSDEAAKNIVTINGTACQKSDLDLVDKYLLVGLKDSALDTLCQLLNCTREAAEAVISNWKQFYNG